MRKIETQMIGIINKFHCEAQGKPVGFYTCKVFGNTSVRPVIREDAKVISTVYLHGNLIASGYYEWQFKMAGWPTPTTKSRINALAQAFGREGVYTKNDKHYSGDKEVNIHDWF